MKIMIKKLLLMVIVSTITIFSSFSQSKENPLTVKSQVFNLFTTEAVLGPKVSLISLPDSVVEIETIPQDYLNGKFIPTNNIRIILKDRSKKYVMKVEKEGYLPEWIPVDPSKAGKSQVELPFNPVYLEPEGKKLKEITVTASKVKFYHRGDTLVYNADAFVLPEGSMLDALLEQLPGVRMDDNGVISVNGRRVEYLLLDGKEFFSNDRKLMLKNIASYTVKTVDVYESHDERFDAARPGQEKLMMDVKLKKEYQKGYIANLEAGYGTSDRWMGRLFGMVFTNKLRLSLIGNANNLNDERRPSQNGAWSPDKLQAGEKKTVKGALDYFYDSKDKGYTINGTLDVTHADFSNLTTQNITTFLPSGNRYGYNFMNQKNKGFLFRTNHRFFMEKPIWVLSIYADYRYGKNRNNEKNNSAEFSKDVQGVKESTLADLYGWSGINASDIVNRVLSSDFIESHSSQAIVRIGYKYKFLKYGSYLEFSLENEYEGKHADRTQDYLLNIGADPNPADRLLRDFHDHPDHSNLFSGTLTWAKNLNPYLWWYEKYTFSHETKNSTSEVWMLADAMSSPDYSSASMRENMPGMVPDYASSFRSELTDNRHELTSQLDYMKDRWMCQIKLPVRIMDRSLFYSRNLMETHPKTTDVSINPYININYFTNPAKWERISLSYNMVEYPFEMVNLVDIPNTTDPLNIFIGNPKLKNIIRHDISLDGNFSVKKVRQNFQVSYTFWRNAIARGFNYDPATGVRTYTPMNINGNNEWRASYSLDLSFGHMDRFSFSNTLEYRRLTNFDFVSEDEIEMTKSRVRTLRFSDRPKLSYGFGSNKVTLFGDLSIAHYTGSLQSFRTFNAGDINYGVSGTFKLPCNFGITTDFTIYMRRGYNDQALNTNNYVWNARLSYSIPKAHLLFMVDGWDLLHDIKNVSYAVNAQGRTETYTTILPRYVMLHIQWNFNKQPKKR